MWHTSSANSSSPTAPAPPLCPTVTTSLLPYWNSAWHTDTAHSWHKAQREREREREGKKKHTHTDLYQSSGAPTVVSVPSIHPVSRTKGPASPIGIFLPLLPLIIRSSFEFCWQLCAPCVFWDVLINLFTLLTLVWESCILSRYSRHGWGLLFSCLVILILALAFDLLSVAQ